MIILHRGAVVKDRADGGNMYGFVFFDLDGTLLNTIDDLAEASNYALETLGCPKHEVGKYKYFVGNGRLKLIERMMPEGSTPEMLEKASELFSEYYGAHSLDHTRPYDGIPELIDKLYESRIKTAVITNKDNVFSGKLIRRFFGDKISAVYGSIPGTPHKPDPYWVERAAADLGADKKDILYVGDSEVDMVLARNACLDSAGVLWGFRTEKELRDNGAKYICSEPSELIGIAVG